jgi:tRNA uridine 5-carbamoylmethylation protein Kti12
MEVLKREKKNFITLIKRNFKQMSVIVPHLAKLNEINLAYVISRFYSRCRLQFISDFNNWRSEVHNLKQLGF